MLSAKRTDTIGWFGSFGRRMTTGFLGKFVMAGGPNAQSCLLLFLLLNLTSAVCADDAAIDDGWRRTKYGWENIATWPARPPELTMSSSDPLPPAVFSEATDRWLLWHPAVVAIGLLAGSVIGLAASGIDLRQQGAV